MSTPRHFAIRPRPLAFAVCCLIGIALTGCGKAKVPAPKPGTMADLQAIVDASSGKVVLVDFWATWCPPCVKQFSHTVHLHQQHEKDGLVVVSVSMDDVEELAAVTKFLGNRGATFANFIKNADSLQEASEDFGVTALPFYVVFDRQGERHDLTNDDPDNPVTPEILDQRVAEFLAQ